MRVAGVGERAVEATDASSVRRMRGADGADLSGAHHLLHGVHVRTLLPPHAVEEAPRPRPEALPARGGAVRPAGPLRRRAHVIGKEVVGSRGIEAVVCDRG